MAAVAGMFFLLVAGMIATTLQARVARAQREIANRRFEDVRALANSLIFDFHDAIQNLPGSTQARQLLVRKALQYLDSLSRDSENDPVLQLELATAYQKLVDVQGYIYGLNLGDTAGAAASYGKALQICESLSRAAPPDVRTKQQLSKEQWQLQECYNCHKLKGAGGKKRGPELDNIGTLLPQDEIAKKILDPKAYKAEGFDAEYEKGKMPDKYKDLMEPKDVQALSAWLATFKNTSVNTPKPIKMK